jgi:hypothetical protein
MVVVDNPLLAPALVGDITKLSQQSGCNFFWHDHPLTLLLMPHPINDNRYPHSGKHEKAA